MKGILANLLIKLGLDSKEFEQGIGKAKSESNSFANGIKKIGGLIAGAFAVDRIISFGKELVNLSGTAEGVRSAFERIGGGAYMEDLKKATANTVSEFNLMKRAVMASNFEIPIENLASLLEFATKRAQETGQSVDYLVESIVLGIGRKSPLILDNLGISAVKLRNELKGAGVEMTTVPQVAAAVGRIAAEEMAKSGSIIETNAIKIQNLTAKWENFKTSLATNPGFKGWVSSELNDINAEFDVMFSKHLTRWEKLLAFLDITGRNTEKLQRKVKALADEEERNNKNRDAYINYMRNLANGIKTTEDAILTEEQLAEAKKKGLEALDKQNEAYQKQADLLMLIADNQRKAISSITGKAVNPEDLKPASDANVQGEFSDVFTRFPLASESEQNIGFNTEKYAKTLAEFENFKNDFAQLVADFGTDVVFEFGQSLGEMFATGNISKDFGKNILSALGGFMAQIGKMLIAFGTAALGFQELLASAFTNPISAGLAIAAGAALVLLGGAISGAVKSGPQTSSGGSVAPAQSYSRATGGGYRGTSENNKVVFEIQGAKLVGVLNNVDRKYGLMR